MLCPRCCSEMEPIESACEQFAVEELRLCPNCYLVVWGDGTHTETRQGVPVKTSFTPVIPR